MTVAILGSGFGLYGYLPALLEGCGAQVVLPERYRERMAARDDVRGLAGRVAWAPDDEAALDAADAVVLSRRPADQPALAAACLKRERIRTLVLEKPPAPTPAASRALLDALRASGRGFRIAFTFRHTGWGRSLLRDGEPRETDEWRIDWLFQAHHYRHGLANWKRLHSLGGGALRFYGVHLVALLAEIGYRRVEASRFSGTEPDEVEKWEAVFSGEGLPRCRVRVDTRSDEALFRVAAVSAQGTSREVCRMGEPFAGIAAPPALRAFDPRAVLLSELCRDVLDGDGIGCGWYESALALWAGAEEKANPGEPTL